MLCISLRNNPKIQEKKKKTTQYSAHRDNCYCWYLFFPTPNISQLQIFEECSFSDFVYMYNLCVTVILFPKCAHITCYLLF